MEFFGGASLFSLPVDVLNALLIEASGFKDVDILCILDVDLMDTTFDFCLARKPLSNSFECLHDVQSCKDVVGSYSIHKCFEDSKKDLILLSSDSVTFVPLFFKRLRRNKHFLHIVVDSFKSLSEEISIP